MKQEVAKTCLFILMFILSTSAFSQSFEPMDIPVQVNNKAVYEFQLLSDSGYTDERGRQVIDVIEGYQVNLALSVDALDGRPVIGLQPEFDLQGSSTLIPLGQSTRLTSTDESGILEFGITAGKQGMDKLTVSFGQNESIVHFNIISLRINDFPTAPSLEVGLSWNELMKAKIDYADGELEITFPELIQKQNGEIVQIWGFMMPLNPDLEQTHFLVTSSPPHCFFHIPGGPAGVVEVFADQGIETSWEPVMLEGTLELVENPTIGVIYQLKDAQLREK